MIEKRGAKGAGVAGALTQQGRIQDFFKKGVVSMRVQGKRPGAREWGRGSWRVMFEYVDFRHFD